MAAASGSNQAGPVAYGSGLNQPSWSTAIAKKVPMKLAWLTDIHLNFCDEPTVERLACEVRAARSGESDSAEGAVDAVVITGDIAEAPSVLDGLVNLRRRFERPIYFVLGNHDYYRGSIYQVRDRLAAACRQDEGLCFLTASGPVSLSSDVALIGHDGWGDARAGDFENSTVRLNDYYLIDELRMRTDDLLKEQLRSLGAEAAAHVRSQLTAALADHEEVVLATHVPPLAGACWYEGRTTNDNWAPHFVCQAVGETILAVMAEHPDRQLTALCGHCHSPGVCQPADNVTIYTAGAVYAQPTVAGVIDTQRTPLVSV